jgi:hypothetical protein
MLRPATEIFKRQFLQQMTGMRFGTTPSRFFRIFAKDILHNYDKEYSEDPFSKTFPYRTNESGEWLESKMKSWTKLLPFFFIRWFAKKYMERRYSYEVEYVKPYEDEDIIFILVSTTSLGLIVKDQSYRE